MAEEQDSTLISKENDISEEDIVKNMSDRRVRDDVEPLTVTLVEMMTWVLKPFREEEEFIQTKEDVMRVSKDIWSRLITVLEYYNDQKYFGDQTEYKMIVDYATSAVSGEMSDYLLFQIMDYIKDPNEALMSHFADYCMKYGHFNKISTYVGVHNAKVYLGKVAMNGVHSENSYYVKKKLPDEKYITPYYAFA